MPANLEDDTLGPNPFPEGDDRREFWRAAARRAAEEDARLKADTLARDPVEMIVHLDYLAALFDIRAKWLAFILVGGYDSAQVYDELLSDMRERVLTWAVPKAPAFMKREGFERELRRRLAQRSAHWRAEALRLARESQERKPAPDKERQPAKWSDVKIEFTSDDRVQVSVLGQTYTRNYADMRFENRTTKAPNRAWVTLRELAESRGVITTSIRGEWRKVEKRMQEIRQRLRAHFSEQGFDIPPASDPLPFVSGEGYRASFSIGVRPSYET